MILDDLTDIENDEQFINHQTSELIKREFLILFITGIAACILVLLFSGIVFMDDLVVFNNNFFLYFSILSFIIAISVTGISYKIYQKFKHKKLLIEEAQQVLKYKYIFWIIFYIAIIIFLFINPSGSTI